MNIEEMITKSLEVGGEEVRNVLPLMALSDTRNDDTKWYMTLFVAIMEDGKGRLFIGYTVDGGERDRIENVFVCAHGDSEEEKLEELIRLVGVGVGERER